MKDNHFRLSSSFQTLFNREQSAQGGKHADPGEKDSKASKSGSRQSFTLDPNASRSLDVPVEILKKRSKTKLESLKDQKKPNQLSIFEPKPEQEAKRQGPRFDRKDQPKKYNLEMATGRKSERRGEAQPSGEVEQLPLHIVRPSELDKSVPAAEPGVTSLFQTPILPCFASEFNGSLHQGEFKEIREKEGVWKIGKMRVKGKEGKLMINGFEFQAKLAEIQGKAGAINEANFFELPKWEGVWVVQPQDSVFQ